MVETSFIFYVILSKGENVIESSECSRELLKAAYAFKAGRAGFMGLAMLIDVQSRMQVEVKLTRPWISVAIFMAVQAKVTLTDWNFQPS